MKNIHVISTDKPSRLVLSNNSILSIIAESNYNFSHIKSVHIYITSDEEIKDGDWFISLYSNSIQRELTLDWTLNKDAYKKIILTTDQDLIKDGIQSIDNEFLEWFVKNPDCEYVEVKSQIVINYSFPRSVYYKYEIIIPQEEKCTCEVGHPYNNLCCKVHGSIPKEEPKPHSFCETPDEKCTMNYCDENGCQNRKRYLVEPHEQETLEEIIDKVSVKEAKDLDLFLKGVKWQQEQDKNKFSEEEVLDLIAGFVDGRHPNIRFIPFKEIKEWFEQFKKK
jgi:hypothetical protein